MLPNPFFERSGPGKLFDGPAFIAAQAAIFAEEPAACRAIALQLPVKPVNGNFGPVAPVRRRKGTAMSYGQPSKEDRHVVDTLGVIAGIDMSNIGRSAGKVCNRAMQIGQLILAYPDFADPARLVV